MYIYTWRKVDKSNAYKGSVNKERYITTKPVISVWLFNSSTYFYHIVRFTKSYHFSRYARACVCSKRKRGTCTFSATPFDNSLKHHYSEILNSYSKSENTLYQIFFHYTTCESTCDTLASLAANQGDNCYHYAWFSARDQVICSYLKISENFMCLVLHDGFWFVHIPFDCMVKF